MGEKELDDRSKIYASFYPIISVPLWNEIADEWTALAEEHDGFEHIPKAKEPKLNFSVIVKTKKFKRTEDLPKESATESVRAKGILLSTAKFFDSDMKKAVTAEYPHIDFTKILLLEEGRRPLTQGTSYLMIGGGCTIAIAAIFIGFFLKNKD